MKTEEEIINTNYDAEQCSRRQWDEEKQEWRRFFNNCAICSFMCPQRAEDFLNEGRKRYVDKKTGLVYWA